MRTTVKDVMTRSVISVNEEAPFKEIVARLSSNGISAVPVVGADGVVLGIVSEADLMLKEEHRAERAGRRPFRRVGHRREREKTDGLVASELMTSPAVTIGPQAGIAEAARLMARHHVKRLPVVDEAGHLVGVVSRRDVIGVFLRPDREIHDEVVHRVLERTLWIDARTVMVGVTDGVVTLEGEVETRSLVSLIEEFVRDVDGVVSVDSRLRFRTDDRHVHPEQPSAWAVLPYGLRA